MNGKTEALEEKEDQAVELLPQGGSISRDFWRSPALDEWAQAQNGPRERVARPFRRCRTFARWVMIMALLAHPAAALEVKLDKRQGIYQLPARINNVITLDFVLDSGAAEVVIPADVVLTLLRTGTVAEEDFLPGQSYTLADGSSLRSPRFIIRTLAVGGYGVSNVAALVAPVAGDLLLGQSFLERFNRWTLDNQRAALILEPRDSPETQAEAEPVSESAVEQETTAVSPKELIASYFDDLQHKRTEAAMAKWKQPPASLAALIQNSQDIQLTSAAVIEENANLARVRVNVAGRTDDGKPERWGGVIELEAIDGSWKIVTMRLKKK